MFYSNPNSLHYEEGISVLNEFICDRCHGVAHRCAAGCYELGDPLRCRSCDRFGVIYVKLWDKLFAPLGQFSGKKPSYWKCLYNQS